MATDVVTRAQPAGTAIGVHEILSAHARHEFDVVSNPESQRGAAVRTSLPDRVYRHLQRARRNHEGVVLAIRAYGAADPVMDNQRED